MKLLFLSGLLSLAAGSAVAQSGITITDADMPVQDDTLRWSAASAAAANVNLQATGANQTWNFSSLTSVMQGRDDYKKASTVNPFFIAIPNAYGYKVSDSLPGLSAIPGASSFVSVSDVYSFFSKKSSPSRFVAEGFSAKISNSPVPAIYSNEDEYYFFPLAYGNAQDSSTYYLNVTLPNTGALKQAGTRKTRVDGWGTIQTPYKTTPTACIRVRSEIVEYDTVTVSVANISQSFPIVRNTVEYRWLANGEHYPLLWVTANKTAGGSETVTSVRYRDTYRANAMAVAGTAPAVRMLTLAPNPASETATLQVPAAWTDYTVELFDVQGKQLYEAKNTAVIPVQQLPSGTYLVRVLSGTETGLVRLVK